MMRKRSSSTGKSRTDAPPIESLILRHNGEALQAKNHKLAKELSECRMKHREEAKNVARLTMENMNLASRCREAIAQAASLKKELSVQKKKTAEAVHQTHQLIAQLKKMSPERRKPTVVVANTDDHNGSVPTAPIMLPAVVVTPDVANHVSSPVRIPEEGTSLEERNRDASSPVRIEEGDSEHKEDDVPIHAPHQRRMDAIGTTPPEMDAIAQGDAVVHLETVSQLCEGAAPPTQLDRPTSETKDPETTVTTTVIAGTALVATTSTTTPIMVDRQLSPKPDAPASSEEENMEEESNDTLAEIIVVTADKPVFPLNSSPMMMMTRKQFNESYDEEYPEEPTLLISHKTHNKPGGSASSLLSSIDAFEASFNTNFPDSFSPKDDDGGSPELYNPFDTTSPAKIDPPTCASPPPPPPALTHGHTTTSPNRLRNPLSPKSTGLEMSPRDTPPRLLTSATAFRLSKTEEKTLLVKTLPMSLQMVDLVHDDDEATTTTSSQAFGVRSETATTTTPRTSHPSGVSTSSPESPDIEVISPNGKTRITLSSSTAISPGSSSSVSPQSTGRASYEMVGSIGNRFKFRSEGPDDETSFHARLLPAQQRSKHNHHRVSPTFLKDYSNVSRFKRQLAISTTTTTSNLRTGPLSSRSNGSTESTTNSEAVSSSSFSSHSKPTSTKATHAADDPIHHSGGRFPRGAARTFQHVGSAAAKVREIKARNRSVSAPRVRTTAATTPSPPSLTFSTDPIHHHQPERPQKLTGYGTARARYERAIQSPKDVSDIPMNNNNDGRQRRNVNLSKRRTAAAEFGTALVAQPFTTVVSSAASPKRLATK